MATTRKKAPAAERILRPPIKRKQKPQKSGAAAVGADHIGSLKPDSKNARRHNPRNVGMIVDSLHTVGAGRSIVIDEDNVILAGNATIEAAGEAGITKLRVIETEGDEIIAIRRRGLSKKQKTRLALTDNRAAELADWEPEVMRDLEPDDLDSLFHPEELAGILGVPPPGPLEKPAAGGKYQEQFGVIVICGNEAEQKEVYERLTADGLECKVVVT